MLQTLIIKSHGISEAIVNKKKISCRVDKKYSDGSSIPLFCCHSTKFVRCCFFPFLVVCVCVCVCVCVILCLFYISVRVHLLQINGILFIIT